MEVAGYIFAQLVTMDLYTRPPMRPKSLAASNARDSRRFGANIVGTEVDLRAKVK
jgi:hypothetical protein